MTPEEERSVSKALGLWASTTSLHGIPRIPISRRPWLKMFWAVIFFAALASFIYQMSSLLQKYYTYPVTTEIRVGFEELEFPAVTLCNLNQVRKSQLEAVGGQALEDEVNMYGRSITDQINRESMSDGQNQLYEGNVSSTVYPSTAGINGTAPRTTSVPETSTRIDTSSDARGIGTNTRKKRQVSYIDAGVKTWNEKHFTLGKNENVPHKRIRRQNIPAVPGNTTNSSSKATPAASTEASTEIITKEEFQYTTPTTITRASNLTNSTNTSMMVTTAKANTPPVNLSTTTRTRMATPIPGTSISSTSIYTTTGQQHHENTDSSQEYTQTTFDVSEAVWFNNTEDTPSAAVESANNMTRLLVSYNLEKRTRMGHTVLSFLQQCTWDGKLCGPQDFAQFNNRYYGNCYTFNAGLDGVTKVSSNAGSLHGFAVTLFIEQDEYVSAVSPSAGVRVTIHNNRKQPFPEETGFDISPGTKTTVSLSMVKISRLKYPYSNCTDEEASLSYELFYNKDYSVEACYKTCQQKHKISICKCADAMLAIPQGESSCQSDKELACLEEVSEVLRRNKTCKYCVEPCKDVHYPTTISSADWPATTYEASLVEELSRRDANLANAIRTSDGVRGNLVRLEIYFRTLQYEQIIEKPAYEFSNFLADIGGQLGVWIGLSFITLVELLELIVNIIVMSLMKKGIKVGGTDKCDMNCCDQKKNYLYTGKDETPFSPFDINRDAGAPPSYERMTKEPISNKSLTPVEQDWPNEKLKTEK